MCPSHDPLRWSAVQMSAAAIPRAKAKLLQFKVPGSTLFFRVFTHVPSVNIYIYIYYILYITYYILHIICYMYIYIYTHHYCIYIYIWLPQNLMIHDNCPCWNCHWTPHEGLTMDSLTCQALGNSLASSKPSMRKAPAPGSGSHLRLTLQCLFHICMACEDWKKLPDVNEEFYWVL